MSAAALIQVNMVVLILLFLSALIMWNRPLLSVFLIAADIEVELKRENSL